MVVSGRCNTPKAGASTHSDKRHVDQSVLPARLLHRPRVAFTSLGLLKDIRAVFGLSILMSFAAFGLVKKLYIWPRLWARKREEALLPLVLPHAFKFIGLSFLVPGVVSLSRLLAFAAPAAYGDLVAAILAVVAAISLSARLPSAALLVWLCNVWGAADFLFAFYQGLFGVQFDLGTLGAAFFIPTAVVPPLLITHGLIFRLLMRPTP